MKQTTLALALIFTTQSAIAQQATEDTLEMTQTLAGPVTPTLFVEFESALKQLLMNYNAQLPLDISNQVKQSIKHFDRPTIQ